MADFTQTQVTVIIASMPSYAAKTMQILNRASVSKIRWREGLPLAKEREAMNPQDPYHSYLLRASAGSGKTYQLSQRYLSLVASGASPRSILTLTFTKKAAAEMRELMNSNQDEA